MINEVQIAKFLEGKNPQKYIVGVEIPYNSNKVSLIINDPVKGKYVAEDTITSFVWFKDEVTKILYAGNRTKITAACKKFGVKISRLKTNVNGQSPSSRMLNGYKFIAQLSGPYGKLLTFFKQGGIDIYGDSHKRLFMAINPVEQYLISSGKRLFKGMDDYDDLHRLQFDLETTGLKPKGDFLSREEIEDVKSRMGTGEELTKYYEFDDFNNPVRHKDARIFQIGVKDNKGFEEIIELDETTPDYHEYTENEREVYLILKFFDYIKKLEPDTIAGYNSENFDWSFIYTRCEVLNVDITLIAKTLDPDNENKIRRSDKTLKLGGESEHYKQTIMWGYNIVDVYHAVRRAKAINSNIKSAGLKYITKFSKLNKPNRVYVEGKEIYNIWADKVTDYAFNDEDGTYYIINEENPLKDGYDKVKGNVIVRRYLLDDLWETEQVDGVFNQAAFLLSKIIPTSYSRSTTMGTASIWKLIMLAWSYENRLTIPDLKPKQNFTGGLSRLLEVGFAKNVAKLDYAALYPNIELTWDIFPDVDITGVMKGMLLYIATTRDKYKALMNEHKDNSRKYTPFLDDKRDSLSKEEIIVLEDQIKSENSLASMYDKKQLPIKILGNSFFGSLGAPYIFNWGDVDCAEETTCRARQYLRLMVRFFDDRDFRALVMDTDGANFAIPDNIVDYRYTPKGTHRFTEASAGKEVEGLQAIVDEFNELYMIGRMGLDIDDVCESTINFSRKNYGNLINGKIKLVGNTIKSSKMPAYIEEFLGEGIKFLLNGQGYEFIQLYNKTVDDIYNFRIPLAKIASKSNIKQSVQNYIEDSKTKTKAGNFKARKAHMELIIQDGIKTNLGDVIYYVNNGTVKSHGDCKVITDKETGERTVKLQCVRIPNDQIENDPNLKGEYNVAKYLAAFNKRIHPLLVCFTPEIREDILIDMVKNKKTKEMELTETIMFTKSQCQLHNGTPFNETDQDTIEQLMIMEDKEIEFWMRTKKVPNNIKELDMDWPLIQKDYHERKELEMINSIKTEKLNVMANIKIMELNEIKHMVDTSQIPTRLNVYGEFDIHDNKDGNPNIFVISKKWGVDLCSIQDILKYEPWAKQRAKWYIQEPNPKLHTYENWLKHLWVETKKNGDKAKSDKIKKELELVGITLETEDYLEIENGVI